MTPPPRTIIFIVECLLVDESRNYKKTIQQKNLKY